MANPLVAPLLGFLGKLSFPRLFVLTASLFLIDLVVPDFVPFADELLLGLGTLLLASFRRRRAPRVSPGATSTGAPRPPIDAERMR